MQKNIPPPRRFHIGRFALLAALLLPLASRAAITWEQATLGNVFLTNETVTIPLKADGTEVTWTLRDFSGATVKTGRSSVSNGRASLKPATGKRGYFELTVIEKRGSTTLSEAKTAFAVLAAFDTSKVKNSPFGVQTHFAQYNSPDVMPLLAKAGIAHIRDEHYWASIETKKGQYTIPGKFTTFMGEAKKNQLTPMLTMTWSNPFYDYSAGAYTAPHTANGRQGFANYARAITRHYGTQVQAVEVWNEYNAGTFIAGPAAKDKPAHYAELLKTVYQTVKAERSDVKVVAGATVPVPHGYFRDLFNKGAMPYLDVISVHPYRPYPDGVQDDIAQLRSLIKEFNNGKEKPIWASEFSMAIDRPEQQYDAAVYLGQIVPLLLSENVERLYYYLATDDSIFKERGLLGSQNNPRGRYAPHPSYVVYANLIRQLYNTTFHSRMAGTSSSTYVLKFMQGATPVHAMWSAQPITIKVKATAKLTVTDIMGQITNITPTDGTATFKLTPEVQYVRGKIDSIVDDSSVLLADAVAGFSNTQGKNGWSYGTVAVSNNKYDAAKFQPLTWKVWNGDNYRWVGGNQYNFINVDQMHPTSAWTVRRWKSTIDGTVAITGEASRGATQGDGVDILIFVDGKQVYKARVAPGKSLDYEVFNVKVKKNSLVDFVVSPNGESSYDATKFTASIIRQ